MTIDIKKFITERIRPHLDQSCPGLMYSDCEEAIEQELEVFVKQIRVDTIAGLVKAIKSVTPELEHGDPVHGLADELAKLLDYKVWEADAELFLMEAIGRAPTCVYCGRRAYSHTADGLWLCGREQCGNSYRENKKGTHG